MEIDKEIKKIIETQLPAQTAGVMKDFIEGAELTEETLRATQGIVKKHEKTIEDYHKKDTMYNQMKAMGEDLDLRVDACNKRDIDLDEEARNMRMTVMETELAMTIANMKNMENLVNKVFGHPSVSISRTVPVAEHPPGVDQYGNQSFGGVTPHQESETTVEGKS